MLRAVCHDLRSLHNVGAIFRTAEGAGFDEVILSGVTGTPPDKRISKVSLGAEEMIPWQKATSEDQLLALLQDDWVIVLEQDPSSYRLHEMPAIPKFRSGKEIQKVSLVVGEELFGVSEKLRERADVIVEIPMYGEKESLNVSVAFGIGAYHVQQAAELAGIFKTDTESLKSRTARNIRPGVLTNGVTSGQGHDK